MKAQVNRPNPDFDEALYRKLYVEVDVSRLRPAHTAAEMTKGLAPWRQCDGRGDAAASSAGQPAAVGSLQTPGKPTSCGASGKA